MIKMKTLRKKLNDFVKEKSKATWNYLNKDVSEVGRDIYSIADKITTKTLDSIFHRNFPNCIGHCRRKNKSHPSKNRLFINHAVNG